jgi:hypothetical protein
MLDRLNKIAFLFGLCFYVIPALPNALKPICPIVRCNGASGEIRSVNFPGNYSNQLDCVTRITVDQGYLVQLIFYVFETEYGSDIVTLYDGFGPMKQRIIQ